MGTSLRLQDFHIDSVDPGIQLFVRMKIADGNRTFNNDNIVPFVHGATYPSMGTSGTNT
jgi:hypothetical protein